MTNWNEDGKCFDLCSLIGARKIDTNRQEFDMAYLPKPSEGVTFKLPPPGTYPAVCYRVIDLGTQPGSVKYPKPKRKVLISWELHDPDTLMDDGKPMSQHERYTLSMNENARFRKILESWRGKAFTEEDYGQFKIESLLGQPCFLGIVHSTGADGKTWANISAISRLPKNMDAPVPENEKVFLWLDNKEDFDPVVFAHLSEKLQDQIKGSPEYKKLMGGKPQEVVYEPPFDDVIPF